MVEINKLGDFLQGCFTGGGHQICLFKHFKLLILILRCQPSADDQFVSMFSIGRILSVRLNAVIKWGRTCTREWLQCYSNAFPFQIQCNLRSTKFKVDPLFAASSQPLLLLPLTTDYNADYFVWVVANDWLTDCLNDEFNGIISGRDSICP